MRQPKNIIGPQVRKFRYQQGWSQSVLAMKCQLLGWDISRDIVAKIENQIRWVADFELQNMAAVFGVDMKTLFPRKPKSTPTPSRSN